MLQSYPLRFIEEANYVNAALHEQEVNEGEFLQNEARLILQIEVLAELFEVSGVVHHSFVELVAVPIDLLLASTECIVCVLVDLAE